MKQLEQLVYCFPSTVLYRDSLNLLKYNPCHGFGQCRNRPPMTIGRNTGFNTNPGDAVSFNRLR